MAVLDELLQHPLRILLPTSSLVVLYAVNLDTPIVLRKSFIVPPRLPVGLNCINHPVFENESPEIQVRRRSKPCGSHLPQLDEATASIDARTEMRIQKALDELSAGKTSFVIAHRLSTIRNADLIFVLRDGDIVETGTHDGLMKRGGVYADLYNSQYEAV